MTLKHSKEYIRCFITLTVEYDRLQDKLDSLGWWRMIKFEKIMSQCREVNLAMEKLGSRVKKYG